MSARARIHTMIPTGDETAEAELDTRLDAYAAEVLAEADTVEAYDGELAMLRGLARCLRLAARSGDGAEVARLLCDHATYDATAREEAKGQSSQPADATPGFFQPGHTYVREHHAATIRFLVEHISNAPDGSYRAAFGWRIEGGDVCWSPFDSDDFTGWIDVTEGDER
ncbi:hypothetical protein ACWEQ7_03975 [Streptomyces sp. NPDC004069]